MPTTTTTTTTTTITTTTSTTTTITTTTTTTTTTITTSPSTSTTSSPDSVEAITFKVGSCVGCPSGNEEGGLKVLLESEDGFECQTEGLDHPGRHDYRGGVIARFDGSEDDGLKVLLES